ncbi:MAG TPA: cysteine desulfurase family protein [Stellaceae bacterium]
MSSSFIRPSRAAAYLDHNATTPVRPEAAAAVAEALAAVGNPSSVHGAGRAARRLVEMARERVAALAGAAPDRLVFTGGGTEANHLALRGAGRTRILISAIEHDSAHAAALAAAGASIGIIPVTRQGVADLPALDRLLGDGAGGPPPLVSVMLANNETGVIQPVAEIAALAHRHGALVHCDAIQAAGKIPVGLEALGVDLLTLSAHKIGGPPGVGALALAPGADVAPLLTGGGQERGRRAGTENVPGIAGFDAAAAAVAASGGASAAAGLAALRDGIERRIEEIAPDARFYGADAPLRLPNTSCILMPGVKAETQVMALDLAGVMVSAGSACSSGKVRPSRVLQAMGVRDEEAGCAIRVSFGWTSTPEDADALVTAWTELYRRTRGSGGGRRARRAA